MYLYHVTYLLNLPSISQSGLQPGYRQTFRGTWYSDYSKGWLFLTEADGVIYWMHKLEEHAEANTDHPEEGWVPIVLCFKRFGGLELEVDPEGTRDSLSNSWKTKQSIPLSREITVWDRDEWSLVQHVDPEAMLEDVLEASEQECEGELDDEDIFEPEACWWIMDYEFFRPPDDELVDE